jgi:hypothetical protein
MISPPMAKALTIGLGGFGRAELEAELGDMAAAQGLNDRPARGVRAGMNTFVQVSVCAGSRLAPAAIQTQL